MLSHCVITSQSMIKWTHSCLFLRCCFWILFFAFVFFARRFQAMMWTSNSSAKSLRANIKFLIDCNLVHELKRDLRILLETFFESPLKDYLKFECNPNEMKMKIPCLYRKLPSLWLNTVVPPTKDRLCEIPNPI